VGGGVGGGGDGWRKQRTLRQDREVPSERLEASPLGPPPELYRAAFFNFLCAGDTPPTAQELAITLFLDRYCPTKKLVPIANSL
jgi:hypothetical protein